MTYESSQVANQFTVSHSVGEMTYHVNHWAVMNKRSKSYDGVKLLLATSNTSLISSIAEVRIVAYY